MKPEWLLVGVGIVTFLAVWWQARATAEAVRATRDSIEANERHFKIVNQQWIDVTDWSVGVDVFRATATRPESGFLYVGFSCRNRTDLPLTLVRIEFFLTGAPPQRSSFSIGLPIIPNGEYRLPSAAGHLLAKAQLEAYREKGCDLSIVGKVYYINALGDARAEPFGQLCWIQLGAEPQLGPLPVSFESTWDRCEQRERQEQQA